MNLRKIELQGIGCAIYQTPETSHWAQWMDADAIRYHGQLIARRVDGVWRGADGERIHPGLARRYGHMRSVGIAT